MIKTLQHALQPVLNDVKTTWSVASGYSVQQVPSSSPPIFSGDRLVLFGQLEGVPEQGNTDMKCYVTLEGLLEYGDKSEAIKYSVSFHTERNLGQSASFSPELTIHRLAAKSLIQEKQNQLDREREGIINISKSANVVSKLTSFVAVDKESHEPIHSAMKCHQRFAAAIDSRYAMAMAMPTALCSRTLCCYAEYDPTIEDSCTWKEIPAETNEIAYGRARRSKSKNENKKGIKGFFKRLSFKKKKGKSEWGSSTKTVASEKKRDAEETPNDKVSCQRIEQNQKEETPSTSVTMSKESLIEIISLQKASGAWELTEQFAKLCGSTKSDLQSACPYTLTAAEDDGKVWATTLALVILAGKFSEKKDEWDMVAKKGKKWLKAHIVDKADYLNTITAAANTLNFPQLQHIQLD